MTGIVPLSDQDAQRAVGLTTTVPVEVLYAAGLVPVDLNNVFIASGEAAALVEEAERCGFPRNSCAWTKGVYAAARRLRLRRVAAVLQGDCSSSRAMAEVLESDGVQVIPFSYPHDPSDASWMALALERFAEAVGVSLDAAEAWRPRLDALRACALEVDRLAWQEDRATGWEQHLWTISCSDFLSDPDRFAAEVGSVLAEARSRPPSPARPRLALLGVPPICDDFFPFLESHGARVVFNEVPRQFAMPQPAASLNEQYRRYTYPYDIFHRLRDIREQMARRRVDAVIHYVQSFCHRQIQDSLVRRALDVPILTLEGDRPGPIDPRTATRLEAFLEMLRR